MTFTNSLIITLSLSCAAIVRVSTNNEYVNPLVGVNSPDPGLIFDKFSSKYYVATTSGDDEQAFPVRESTNLTGYIFASKEHWPSWCMSDFWAHEFHYVTRTVTTFNNREYPLNFYNVYFVCRDNKTQLLSIGVAQPSFNLSDPNPQANNGYYIDAIGYPLILGNVTSGIGFIDLWRL